jgi:hypothetical protein
MNHSGGTRTSDPQSTGRSDRGSIFRFAGQTKSYGPRPRITPTKPRNQHDRRG